jgi:hypothetical protein
MIIHQPHHRSHRIAFKPLSALTGDRLAAALGRALDDGYHYLPRVIAGATVDAGTAIDVVIVGIGGTWAITRTNESGRFRKRNGHWYRWNRSTESWVPWEAQPIMTARLAGHRLEGYLERATLPATVEPVLLGGSGAEIGWDEGERPGVHVHDDASRLAARIARDEVLSRQQVDRIVALLDPRQPLPRLAPSTQG